MYAYWQLEEQLLDWGSQVTQKWHRRSFGDKLLITAVAIVALVATIAMIRKFIEESEFKKWYYVWLMTSNDTFYAHRWRVQLFGCMDLSSSIVEIGAGGGANFGYYPANSTVICVEPMAEFTEFAQKNVTKYGQHLKSVSTLKCYAEDITTLIPRNSVDYVVCTYVLCSVKDVELVLRNIHYILKPGGIFFYLEHSQSDSQPMRLYQEMMTPIFSRILNGCHYNRQPEKTIEQIGIFRETMHSLNTAHPIPYYHPERTQVWGRAVKFNPRLKDIDTRNNLLARASDIPWPSSKQKLELRKS